MRLVSTPYRWLPRTVWKNLDHWFYDIRNGLSNIPLFFEAVWHFRSWDSDGLLEIIQVATKEMSRCHKEFGHCMNSEKTAKQLIAASELCRRLREDNYFENAGYRQGESWDNLPEYQKTQIARHSALVSKNDAIYLGKLFRFVQGWWD